MATPELADAFRIASGIAREARDQSVFGFQALLIGTISTEHRMSVWLRTYFEESDVNLRSIATVLTTTGPSSRTSPAVAGQDAGLPPGPWLVTGSAFTWLASANAFRVDQRSVWVGLRHVVGALVFSSTTHNAWFKGLGIDRSPWGRAYLTCVRRDLGEADFKFWRGVAMETGIDLGP